MRGGYSSPGYNFDTYDGDLADQLRLLIWMLKSPQINWDVPSMLLTLLNHVKCVRKGLMTIPYTIHVW